MSDSPLVGLWLKVALAVVAAAAAVSIGYIVTGTEVKDPAVGLAATPCPEALELARGTIGIDDTGVTRFVVLIDPASNDPTEARLIAQRLQPMLVPYLESGITVEVLVDPGLGAATSVSACLDGSEVFAVRNANDIRQQRHLAAATEAVTDVIKSMVVSAPVTEAGGPVRLLRHSQRIGSPTGNLMVVLWSDLLANDGSCLDPEGAEGSDETALAVVARCESIGAVAAIEADLTLLGVGESPRSGQFRYWADLVGDGLCAALTESATCTP